MLLGCRNVVALSRCAAVFSRLVPSLKVASLPNPGRQDEALANALLVLGCPPRFRRVAPSRRRLEASRSGGPVQTQEPHHDPMTRADDRDMQWQRLAPRTQEASGTAVAGLAKYSGCAPDQMTQHWTCPLHRARHHEWADLAPREQGVSVASGASPVPATHRLWGFLGARHGGDRPR
jgi:hypothetical protein